MSNVVEFRMRASGSSDEFGQPDFAVAVRNQIAGWRTIASVLRKLEAQMSKYEDKVRTLPASPEAGQAISSLVSGRVELRRLIAECLSQEKESERCLRRAEQKPRQQEESAHRH